MTRVLFIIAFILCFGTSFAQDNKIILDIENIKVLKGNLMIAIFNNEVDFKAKQNPSFADTINISSHSATTKFKNIPNGNYAIAIYHDENSDGNLNTVKLGIPKEGVGFSGSKKSILKVPKFDHCSFELTNDTTIVIGLHYRANNSDSSKAD